jgi:hypothetical protein
MLFPTTVKATKRTIKLRPRACLDPKRWVWPLPAYEDVQPRIVGRSNDSRLAVDIGYGDALPRTQLVPVYAVQDGVIQLARKTDSGFALVVEHQREWSTYYARLARMSCSPTWDQSRPKVRVCAGSLLGFASSDAPIRFELCKWTEDTGFVATPPQTHLATWAVLYELDPNPVVASNTMKPAA